MITLSLPTISGYSIKAFELYSVTTATSTTYQNAMWTTHLMDVAGSQGASGTQNDWTWMGRMYQFTAVGTGTADYCWMYNGSLYVDNDSSGRGFSVSGMKYRAIAFYTN